jgi:hypothetical protein
MEFQAAWYAGRLRQELTLHNHFYARGRAHVESYGGAPVIVYSPDNGRHGNFFDAAYDAISAHPEWMRRFNKVHAQAARGLPKPHLYPKRRWRELDSSMSSDALLMNIFCAPGVGDAAALRKSLGIDAEAAPIFGWKARLPLSDAPPNRPKPVFPKPILPKVDRTEIDMRFGSLLVEAKLTEIGFQTRSAPIVEAYRDFDAVFDRELLPRAEIATSRWMHASEFPENDSQEFESLIGDPESFSNCDCSFRPAGEPGYSSYQLIRGVLAAHATGCSFCVLHDARRPDLREEWFSVMAAVKSADLRVRLKVLTWQELAAYLPAGLQEFLDIKYGIVPPGQAPTPIAEADS